MQLIIHQILTLKTLQIFTKKCNAKPYLFLVIDTTLPSDNPLHFRKNLLGRILKVNMAIYVEIRDIRLQYDINREASKISTFSSGKI